jgi:hypothetical protein
LLLRLSSLFSLLLLRLSSLLPRLLLLLLWLRSLFSLLLLCLFLSLILLTLPLDLLLSLLLLSRPLLLLPDLVLPSLLLNPFLSLFLRTLPLDLVLPSLLLHPFLSLFLRALLLELLLSLRLHPFLSLLLRALPLDFRLPLSLCLCFRGRLEPFVPPRLTHLRIPPEFPTLLVVHSRRKRLLRRNRLGRLHPVSAHVTGNGQLITPDGRERRRARHPLDRLGFERPSRGPLDRAHVRAPVDDDVVLDVQVVDDGRVVDDRRSSILRHDVATQTCRRKLMSRHEHERAARYRYGRAERESAGRKAERE